MEVLYSQDDFDGINNIGVLSPERELNNSNFKLSDTLPYGPLRSVLLDCLDVNEKNVVSSISLADSEPPLSSGGSLYKSKPVHLSTNLSENSNPKKRKAISTKL